VATLALVGFLALAPVAEATVLRGLTTDDLRSRAELIVEGKITRVRTIQSDGRIETLAVLRVGEVHKGEARRRIEVRTLGGAMGSQRMVVPGAANLAKGDRVLLFLYGDADSWRPVGMFQGAWRLDADGVVARASDSGGASLLRPSSGVAAVDAGQQTVRRLVGQGAGQ
jgi:hypothetical protein